jgi:hypothetical protein
VVGHGVPGIRDYLQVSQQQSIFYPMTKDSSKIYGQILESTEFDDFMSQYSKNVLVSFGTTFMPNEVLCKLLVETFNHFKQVGFIVSLKNNEEVQSYSIVTQLIEERKLTNVIVKNFLP